MSDPREHQLATSPIGPLLRRLALPAIAAQLVNVLYNMVDRIYIGHIPQVGAQALTGLGVTMPLIIAVSSFAALVSMGGAPRASIMQGRGEHDQAEQILGNCTLLLACMALVLTVGLRVWGRQLLLLFGASSQTLPYALDYLQVYALGTLFVQLSLGLNAFITAQGFSTVSMYTVLIGAALNILLDPVFIFLLGMGVQGAALATILSQAVSSLWVLRFLTGKRTSLKIRRQNLRLSPGVVLPCLALGLSPFIMQFTESVISVSFNRSLAQYGGDIAVGAMTILSSIMQFSLLPLNGLAQGAQPILSFNFGAGQMGRVKSTFRLLLGACLGYSTALWALCMVAPGLPVGLFTNDPALSQYAARALRVYIAGSLLLGAQVACQQTFIALGNAQASVFLALLRKVFLLLPLIYLLPRWVPQPALGVFLAEPVADLAAVCVTAAVFTRSFKKLPQKRPGPPAP